MDIMNLLFPLYVPKLEKPHFSKAIWEIARRELKAFEAQCDEDFLTRAEIDRRLDRLL